MPSEKSRYLKDRRPRKLLGNYPDEKKALFDSLADESAEELLEILDQAYEAMAPPQRRNVFGKRLEVLRDNVLTGDRLVQEIKVFCEESYNGEFYAPFEINSKNFMHKPAETEEWFSRLGELLTAATRLVDAGDCQNAAEAFELLYELIDSMESGDEIVFGDEIGSWMIPVHEHECVAAYLMAVAKIENAVGFTITAIELLKRDKQNGFTLKAHAAANAAGSTDQVRAYNAKVELLGLKTSLDRI